ncbi:50S ribosomal protein L10 [Candidatus Saccharibacteria bacterium]|nr:50S ribosomal protein L10 [Candidatus Saccharibacteria bacterium]
MALSKDKKKEIVAEASDLLAESKLTVFARYPGTSVKSMQQLRNDSRNNGTQIRVIKNRLFKKAISKNENYKDLDTGIIQGQLLYAFNSQDEVAPAQSLANFAKIEPQLEFVGALTADGRMLEPDEIKTLASLPSKLQLRAQLVGTFAAPASSFVRVLAGNVRGVMNVLSARATNISQ